MDQLKNYADFVGARDEKFFKTTLFQTSNLMLGLNCLEPGQVQPVHAHADQAKFYFVVEGTGTFTLGAENWVAGVGDVVWAPEGVEHGVENTGADRLVLLMGIAPAPPAK